MWVAVGRLVTAVIGIVTIRFSTTMLPPEQFGMLAVLVTFQSFSGLFLVNPVGQYINRHTHAWADEGSLLSRLSRYRVWILCAAMVGAIGGFSWVLSQPIPWGERFLVAALVMFMIVVATANATFIPLLNMLGKRALATGWAGATSILGLSLSILLTYYFNGGFAWFAGQALGMAFGALGAAVSIRKMLPNQPTVHWPLLEPGALRTFIMPLAVATGFMWWLMSGYRLLLEAHWGLAALGSAVVGISLAAQLWGLLETLAMQFLYPMFYRQIALEDSPERRSAFSDLLNTLGPVYLVMSAATVVAAPALLKLFVNSAYANVVTFVILGSVVECCRALSNVLATAAQVERKMFALIIPYSVGAVVLMFGIFLNNTDKSILDSIFVLVGAGFSTLITMAIIMRKLQPFNIDWLRWCSALSVIFFASFFVGHESLLPNDFSTAVIQVAITGIFALLATGALLWKNPGCERLTAVRLNSK